MEYPAHVCVCVCRMYFFSFFNFHCESTKEYEQSLEIVLNYPRAKAEKVDIILSAWSACECYVCMCVVGVALLTVKQRS